MQKRFLVLMVISSCICIATAWAQETGQIVAPLNGEYIKGWLLLGPFSPEDLNRDFAVDRTWQFSLHFGPFGRFILLMVGLLLLGIGIHDIRRSRALRVEKLRLQHELEDARQIQTGLLPESVPQIEGFDIAGFSKPAREVGGDFFDYLSLGDGKTGIAVADVSGKGLKGAMSAVLTSGMLNIEAEKIGGSCGSILTALNTDLHPRTEKQMFTALGLAILGPNAGTLQWANAAQPYPLVKRGEEVFEFKSDSELPLGMMPNVAYPDWELGLQSGDIVVFYTDGIIEAEDEVEEMYGTERLEQVVTRMNPTMNAEEIIEVILQDVTGFAGTAEQYDDMTVVAVKRL